MDDSRNNTFILITSLQNSAVRLIIQSYPFYKTNYYTVNIPLQLEGYILSF